MEIDLKPDVVTVAATRADGGLTVSRFITQEYREPNEKERARGVTGKVPNGKPREITPEVVNEVYSRRVALIAEGKKPPGDAVVSWEFVPNDYVTEDTDQAFRNAWKHKRGGKKPDHDMDKAKEIHRVYLRHARLAEFCRLDTAALIADEAGDVTAKRTIGAQKQQFRDVTEDERIEACKTVEELKALRLDVLLPEITKGVSYMKEKMKVSPFIPALAKEAK